MFQGAQKEHWDAPGIQSPPAGLPWGGAVSLSPEANVITSQGCRTDPGVRVPALPLTSCVTSDKSFYLLEPQFAYFKNVASSSTFLMGL